MIEQGSDEENARRYVCARCAQYSKSPGMCPTHRSDELSDSHNDDVVYTLEHLDDSAAQRLTRVGTLAGGVLGLLAGVMVMTSNVQTVEMFMLSWVTLPFIGGGLGHVVGAYLGKRQRRFGHWIAQQRTRVNQRPLRADESEPLKR